MAENAIISDLEFAPQLTDDMVFAVEDTKNTYSATLGELRNQLNKVFVEVKDVDFNALVDDGFYQVSGTLNNQPTTGQITWLVRVVKDGKVIVQTAFSMDTDNYKKEYVRRYDGSVWDVWFAKDVEALQASVTERASTDLANVTVEGKKRSINWGMPDYTKRITRGSGTPFTMPYDGYVLAVSVQGGGFSINIDGFSFQWWKDEGFAVSQNSIIFPVANGSTVTVEATVLIVSMPCLGEI